MPYVKNQNVRIYFQVEGAGPPLILQHGFTDSLVTWYERGYVDLLKQRYRLILIDARGHHLSDKPHDEAAYGEENFAADVVAVMDGLNVSKAHYLGYSMGGWIGFALGRSVPDRFTAMVLGGASPYPFSQGAEDPMMPVLLQREVCTFFDGYLTPGFEDRLRDCDTDALIACRRKRFATTGFEDSLGKMIMPSLLYAGDADPIFQDVKRAAEAMPNAQFFSLPGYRHVQGMMESQAVLPRIVQFLRDASRR